MNFRIIMLCLSSLSGCATIVGSNTYPVAINSSPSEAKFSVSNQSGQEVTSGTTPATVTLKSNADSFSGERYLVKYSKEGYIDGVSSVNSTTNNWVYGNLLIGGLIGLFVDLSSGAIWELPSSVSTSLTKK